MTNLIIYLFILIANVVAILLIYHSFDRNIEKTKKLLYTMISMGLIYILVLIIYFFSSIGLDKETTTKAKDMIIFSFVPVNAIILVPFLLRSFKKSKDREITIEQLNKRAIVVVIIGIALIIGEFFYFRNIEKGIINMINEQQTKNINQNTLENNEIQNETMLNEITENVLNEENNEISENTTKNEIVNNTISNVE